jgi:hypothetical protein
MRPTPDAGIGKNATLNFSQFGEALLKIFAPRRHCQRGPTLVAPCVWGHRSENAGLAQLVEQLICNQ